MKAGKTFTEHAKKLRFKLEIMTPILKNFIQERAEIAKTKTQRLQENEIDEHRSIVDDFVLSANGEKKIDAKMINHLFFKNNYALIEFISSILTKNFSDEIRTVNFWSEKDSFIQELFSKENLALDSYILWNFIQYKIIYSSLNEIESFISFLENRGASLEVIVEKVMNYNLLYTRLGRKEYIESTFATFLKSRLKGSSSLLGLKKTKGIGDHLHELIKSNKLTYNKFEVLRFLFDNAPECLQEEYNYYCIDLDYNQSKKPNTQIVWFLLEKDPIKFENIILECYTKCTISSEEWFSLFWKLNALISGKYHNHIVEIGEIALKQNQSDPKNEQYFYSMYCTEGEIAVLYSRYLLGLDKENGILKLKEYLEKSHFLSTNYLQFIEEEFGTESLPYLELAVPKNPKIVDGGYRNYFKTLFEILSKYDVSKSTEIYIHFALTLANAQTRKLTCLFLAKYIDQITPRALELLAGKNADSRIVGALLLVHSQDESVQKTLLETIDKEKSDDIRDLLLENLQEIIFEHPFSLAKVKEMIRLADERKKLNNWNEKLLDEATLPKLYWNESHEILTPEEIRFLIYRAKRAKGLNTDLEERQILHHINKEKSTAFALSLLKAYQESGMDNKVKYYMFLAAILGGDDALNKLLTLFKNSITNKKYKLAESIVGSIVMVGSNKALRLVDMISRQYINKRPSVGNAAKEALEAVAVELELTADQLSDRIIPDFGFESNFKTLEIAGETYRAFISSDFKINYLNEDNKVKKSLPKEASKELSTEIKEIEKEIKEVLKTQKGRLEKFLIEQRRWTVEEWKTYYLHNPIMVNYVQRLLWGLYENQTLITVFYCDENLDLYDVENEEVALDSEFRIGIVHPIQLNDEQLKLWKDKVYDENMEFEFPIIDRKIYRKDSKELDVNHTKIFDGKEIPKGADFVAPFLLKKGWLKETGDGGSLNFSKIDSTHNIVAVPYIEGPAVFYQGGETKATIHQIVFYRENWSNKIPLKDIPEVFYSEVLADLDDLINA